MANFFSGVIMVDFFFFALRSCSLCLLHPGAFFYFFDFFSLFFSFILLVSLSLLFSLLSLFFSLRCLYSQCQLPVFRLFQSAYFSFPLWRSSCFPFPQLPFSTCFLSPIVQLSSWLIFSFPSGCPSFALQDLF